MIAGLCLLLSLTVAPLGAKATQVGHGPLSGKILKLPGRVVHVEQGDVNGDGLRDLLVFWRQGFPPRSTARLSVFPMGAKDLDDKPVQVLSLPAFSVAFDVGDADGDGRVDVLLLAGDGVWALRGRSDGRFAETPVALLKRPFPRRIAAPSCAC